VATDIEQQRGSGSARRLGYVPQLTGLRALAIALVLAYALDGAGLGGGGWVGVDVFFVLTGFLITTQLLERGVNGGSISTALGDFYLRRILRLWPAFLVFLAAVAAYARLAHAAEFSSWAHELLLGLTGRINLYSIHHSAHPGIGQLWTLCTQEQFYLVWPVVVLLCLRWLPRRSVFVVAGIGAAASLVEGIVLVSEHVDHRRVFYAPDTNAASLLIGCIVGAGFTAGYFDRLAGTRFVRVFPLLFVAVLAVWTAGVSEHAVWPFAGSVQALCLATGVTIVCLALAPGTRLGQLLGHPATVRAGLLSFSLYLWYQVALSAGPKAGPGFEAHAIHVGVQLLLLVELPVLSYYLIERRGRHLTSLVSGHRSRTIRGRTEAVAALDPASATGDDDAEFGLFDELVAMDGAISPRTPTLEMHQ
jgi:peptidoglycan/LPS O-acetylase OafA/YrhL